MAMALPAHASEWPASGLPPPISCSPMGILFCSDGDSGSAADRSPNGPSARTGLPQRFPAVTGPTIFYHEICRNLTHENQRS
jgi:hypothetical protein